jgi:hypothetical protein
MDEYLDEIEEYKQSLYGQGLNEKEFHDKVNEFKQNLKKSKTDLIQEVQQLREENATAFMAVAQVYEDLLS